MTAGILELAPPVGEWGPFVAGIALKSTALILLALLVAALLRRGSAASRHLVWALAIGSLLVLPAPPAVLPMWETSALDWVRPFFDRVSPDPGGPSFGPATLGPPASPADRPLVEASGPRTPGWTGVTALWFAVSLALLLRIAWGHGKHLRVIREARRLEVGRIASVARGLAEEMGVERVSFYESEPDAMPCAWGLRAPAILMPSSASSWSSDRLRSVLVHELAHVRRHDCGLQLLAEVVRAIYWPHPLVWIAVRRLRAESEGACDDVVLAAGARPSTYATDLLELARSLRPGPRVAVVGMARRPRLDDRVRALLDEGRSRAPVARSAVIPAALASATLVIVLALARPVVGGETEGARGGAGERPVPGNAACTPIATEEPMNPRRLIPPLVVAATFGCGEQTVMPEAGAPVVESVVEQAPARQSGTRRLAVVDIATGLAVMVDSTSGLVLFSVPVDGRVPRDSVVTERIRVLLDSLSSSVRLPPPTRWTPTYANDIAPLLQTKCVGCHRMGGSGPMALETYDQTRPWGPLIGQRVSEMVAGEAWHELRSAPGTRELHWRLAPDEVYTIREWLRARMPSGL